MNEGKCCVFLSGKAVIQQTVCVLRDLVDSISGEATKSRQICYHSLQESVQVTLALFPLLIQQPGKWSSGDSVTPFNYIILFDQFHRDREIV